MAPARQQGMCSTVAAKEFATDERNIATLYVR